MENKTPELYAFIDKMDSELGDVWASDRDCLANVLDTYASLQCAEIKEAIAASERIRMSDAQSAIREANSLRGRIEQMKEENERLKDEIKALAPKSEMSRTVDPKGYATAAAKILHALHLRIGEDVNEHAMPVICQIIKNNVPDLQEEVERLRETIIRIEKAYWADPEPNGEEIESLLKQALSSKESKTDNP